MTDASRVSIAIHAVFDPDAEAVGVSADPSPAFEQGDDPRAMIESLAAVTAKANCIAAQVIAAYEADDDRKKELLEHYAALKENMLNDMLRQQDRASASGTPGSPGAGD